MTLQVKRMLLHICVPQGYVDLGHTLRILLDRRHLQQSYPTGRLWPTCSSQCIKLQSPGQPLPHLWLRQQLESLSSFPPLAMTFCTPPKLVVGHGTAQHGKLKVRLGPCSVQCSRESPLVQPSEPEAAQPLVCWTALIYRMLQSSLPTTWNWTKCSFTNIREREKNH